ncbi:hypothetical protein TNIN_380241 [Trichonephila inaurata madagascariensis]|uniref:Uncharacterized protein n=1 Tax=Trichonephila inaurata madagascariensis TaxID=2747483 RepID=A0A8X6WZ31_9ARAC|nr:hypothetical protein TNIN_380241 [Trichonephila inaurata madagascariensis]
MASSLMVRKRGAFVPAAISNTPGMASLNSLSQKRRGPRIGSASLAAAINVAAGLAVFCAATTSQVTLLFLPLPGLLVTLYGCF